MTEEAIAKIIADQNKFMKTLLEDQKGFLQSMLNNSSSSGPTHSDGAMVPSFHAFAKGQDNWESYMQQMTQHFSAYSVTSEEKKKAFFLTWIGSETFELLKKLYGTNDLGTHTYEEMVKKLSEHFQEQIHVVSARYNFNKCLIKPTQSYREWVAELRGIARQCQFKCAGDNCTSTYVDEMIRDMLILHTPHDTVRTAALQKLKPTLEEVLLIAESFMSTSSATNSIKQQQSQEKVPEVNAITAQAKNRAKKDKQNKKCYSCGGAHKRSECKFREALCWSCGRERHISRVCVSKSEKTNSKKGKTPNKKSNEKSGVHTNAIDVIESVYNMTEEIMKDNKKKYINVEISNATITFQMDSGSSVYVITLHTYKQLGKPKLRKCTRPIYAYGKKAIEILGEFETKIKCNESEKLAVLVVAKVDSGQNLFGMDLFKTFNFDIVQINSVEADEKELKAEADKLFTKYKDLFEPALGTVPNFKAHIQLKNSAVPKYCKSRQIPFALFGKFKAEAERLEQAGVWKRVKFSDWASPIVLTPKPDGSLRICTDFKVSINHQIDIERFPLPTREQLLHKIRYGQIFSKIDLKDAYMQLELDEESKKLLVANTPLGLFEYQRLPYGIASAPAIFQRFLEQILQDVEGCGNYLDDIIVASPTVEEHIQRLEQIFKILREWGIKCKQNKCSLFQDHIDYLGRRISAEGILPEQSGVTAIKNLKRPENIKEVEALMGKINYYHSYIPNMSQIAAPIKQLRRKNTRFKWTQQHEQAFNSLKQHIVNATQLVHFQEHLPIILATDASSFGIGAVISHVYEDGSEHPIAFASKTLNVHQVKYSQIEKEGLAIVFGVQKFHQYLYGRKFTLLTDHKPLVSIFNPGKNLPTTTTNRLQRWAIILMAYQFEIKYKPTAQHGNADALSRLPEGPDDTFDRGEDCYAIEELDTPIDADVIRFHTNKDDVLKAVRRFIQKGWPTSVGPEQAEILPYFQRNASFVLINDLICLQGHSNRVVIPQTLRQRLLQLLHESHWGVVRMKQLARRYCWWPGIDRDIERLASSCATCKVASVSPPKEFSSWPEAQHPWERVHIDFAGPFLQHMWLVCVDAYSQYPYIVQLTGTTSEQTIRALSSIFAIEGLPETLVSDNGPQLTSATFQDFCSKNGIKHVTTAPFHPASNGLAERFVRTFKTSVKKNLDDGIPLGDAVTKFLATYRSMPNAKDKSPAELLHGRSVRTLLTQILPQKKPPKKNAATPKYNDDCKVYLRNYSSGPKWIEGVIERSLGNMVYLVKTPT